MSIKSTAASVEFRNVGKSYGQVKAIKDVSFTVEAGTLVTLLGPSGCGKTTTLRMIAGLEQASSGQIFIGDQDVTNASVMMRDVSMVFQSYALFPHMSVLENVAYGLREQGLKKDQAYSQAEEGMAMVGLTGFGDRMPNQLSGGQQQRVAVARALVLKPKVLLFDEPLSNLDAKLRRKVREEIRELQQSLGLTSVYVTHDQEEAMAVSDKIIVMNESVISQHGTPHQLYEQPQNTFIADFIGDATLVKGTYISHDEKQVKVQLDNIEVDLAHRNISNLQGSLDIAIRPNSIYVTIEPSTHSSGQTIKGTVTKSVYLGGHVEYELETALGSLFAVDHQAQQAIASGSSVYVNIASQGIALVG
ncbi:MAG: ABC transporter ATP-binding protein [Oceanospirillaceae bacterium]